MKDNFDLHEWNKKRYLGELDIDQNINKDDEGSSFNITRGGDDPKIGAEEESDANVVGENQSHLEFLSKYLEKMHPDLNFEVSDFDDIRVYGSQGDLFKFGNKMHGKKFGEYEVFAVDDDDRGEIVRIVKSDSILRENVEEGVVKDMHTFLNDLRDSGVTNMFGAAPYLQAEFNLDKKEARELLAYWMGSYRNPELEEGSCGYTPDGKPRSKPAGPNEAEAIGLSPGEMEMGDDGKMHNVKASNSERKRAMRSVVDILRDELDVDQDDAFDYIRTHRDDLFDGTVDAFSKEEVVDDYNEYSYLNKINRDADQADYQVGPER